MCQELVMKWTSADSLCSPKAYSLKVKLLSRV